MADRAPLPPGELPHITDTDPPPLHPATVIGDGYVTVDQTKLPKAEHERAHDPARSGTAAHTTATITVTRTTAH